MDKNNNGSDAKQSQDLPDVIEDVEENQGENSPSQNGTDRNPSPEQEEAKEGEDEKS